MYECNSWEYLERAFYIPIDWSEDKIIILSRTFHMVIHSVVAQIVIMAAINIYLSDVLLSKLNWSARFFIFLNWESNVCRRWFPRALHKASDEFLSKQIWRISLFGRSHWTCFFLFFFQCTWWTNNFRSNCTTLDQTFF